MGPQGSSTRDFTHFCIKVDLSMPGRVQLIPCDGSTPLSLSLSLSLTLFILCVCVYSMLANQTSCVELVRQPCTTLCDKMVRQHCATTSHDNLMRGVWLRRRFVQPHLPAHCAGPCATFCTRPCTSIVRGILNKLTYYI